MLSDLLEVGSLVPVPCARGWRAGVHASRSADSTSVVLRNLSAIAQTRERNCLSAWPLDDWSINNRRLGEIFVDFFVGVFVVFFCTTATLSTLTAFYGCVDWASRGRESVLGVSVSIFARR